MYSYSVNMFQSKTGELSYVPRILDMELMENKIYVL